MMPRLALHTWSLDTTPLPHALAAAKAAGWDGIELRRLDYARAAEAGHDAGWVAEIMTRLAQAKINVTAVDAVCATGGAFGAILWVEQRDVAKAAKALGAA